MSTLLDATGEHAETWTVVADDEPLPAEGAVVVSLARWEKDREALAARAQPFGLRLANTVDVATLDESAFEVALIVLEFPGFADGRAYSQARLLRDARGYRGQIRATGAAVVRDQLLGMRRSGIDVFELRADQSPSACLQALTEFSLAYQPGCDPLPRVRALRRRTATE